MDVPCDPFQPFGDHGNTLPERFLRKDREEPEEEPLGSRQFKIEETGAEEELLKGAQFSRDLEELSRD